MLAPRPWDPRGAGGGECGWGSGLGWAPGLRGARRTARRPLTRQLPDRGFGYSGASAGQPPVAGHTGPPTLRPVDAHARGAPRLPGAHRDGARSSRLCPHRPTPSRPRLRRLRNRTKTRALSPAARPPGRPSMERPWRVEGIGLLCPHGVPATSRRGHHGESPAGPETRNSAGLEEPLRTSP